MDITINLLALNLLLVETISRNQIINFENRIGALLQVVTNYWLFSII
jgi:hypothetical protein